MNRIFVYGSLLDPAELKDTFPDATGTTETRLDGYVRDFSKATAGWGESEPSRVFAIQEAPNEWCNGLVVSGVSEDSLSRFEEREWEYQICELDSQRFTPYDGQEIAEGSVYTSVLDREFHASPDVPIASDYRSLCYQAAQQYSTDFYTDFVASTRNYYASSD